MSAIARLEQLDHELGACGTLATDRRQATRLVTLHQALARERMTGEAADAFAIALAAIAEAIHVGFPDNLLRDLDYLAASLARELSSGRRERFDESVALAVEIQSQFGSGTSIRFRYAHDFLYGFDWAKWVGRAPAERSTALPFDLEFLRYMRVRGDELIELIAADDPKYPRLSEGLARNPFRFSREPDGELALHRDLAGRGLLPLEAWSTDATPIWDRAYAELREERARDLGLVSA